jgi:hypothetical protein
MISESCTDQACSNIHRNDAQKKEDYSKVTDRKFTASAGVPVSVLDSEYLRSSKDLIDEIELYCTLV